MKTINVGEIDARYLVFQGGRPDRFHIAVNRECSALEKGRFEVQNSCEISNSCDWNVASWILQADGFGKHWYQVANVDMFDPPYAIVRADNEQEAFEVFMDETDACLIQESDLKDYDEERLDYDSNGRPMDTDNLFIAKLQLVKIII